VERYDSDNERATSEATNDSLSGSARLASRLKETGYLKSMLSRRQLQALLCAAQQALYPQTDHQTEKQ